MVKLKVSDNVTSYDVGEKPFHPDQTRGKWSSNWDFFAACISHSFGIRNFTIVPLVLIQVGGVYFIIPYIIGLLVFTIPIFFIQSFLGQFSSSGFISAFRIAPLFKGIGYVILSLNFLSSTYLGVRVAMPLFYFFVSFDSVLPWTTCGNRWNSKNCRTTDFRDLNNTFRYYSYRQLGAAEYLNYEVSMTGQDNWYFPWKIFLCSMAVWIVFGFILTRNVSTIGKIFRYSAILICTILVAVFMRAILLSEAGKTLKKVALNEIKPMIWVTSPYILTFAFGSGWATTLTLASYNNFKCNIGKLSIMVCFTHMIIMMLSAITAIVFEAQLSKILQFNMSSVTIQPLQWIYGSIPVIFEYSKASNLWSMLFFLMLFLGEFTSLICQGLAILTAVFDEFEKWRAFKREITIGFVALLAIFSTLFVSNIGISLANNLYSAASASQMVIAFFELMIVVWVYGRLRFQRDVKFMLNENYATWKFFMVRFITPIFTLAALGLALFESVMFAFFSSGVLLIFIAILIKITPILCIPGYMAVKLISTSGQFLHRFKKLCRPNDWYPANSSDREKYDSIIGSSEIANQLVIEDIEVQS